MNIIEYTYTIHGPDKITEHRRLNLRLFYVRLKDIIYEREKGYNYYFGLPLPVGLTWFRLDNKYNYNADKRIKKFILSRAESLLSDLQPNP